MVGRCPLASFGTSKANGQGQEMSEFSRVDVKVGDLKTLGGCNGCTRHIDTEEMRTTLHEIWQITLGSISVRVCPECKHELLEKLNRK